MKSIGIILLCIALVNPDTNEIASWSYEIDSNAGENPTIVQLVFKARIKKGWYLYSSDIEENLGPIPLRVQWDPSEEYTLEGGLQPLGAYSKYDPVWEGKVSYFKDKAVIRQRVQRKPGSRITGTISGQLCNAKDGECIPFRESFQF